MTDAVFPRVVVPRSLERLIAMVEMAQQPLLLFPADWDDDKVDAFLERVGEGGEDIVLVPVKLNVTKRSETT